MVSEFRNYASQPVGCRTRELFLFFMDSKGNRKHFVGLHFVWHGLESCCCLSVSKALRQKHLLQRFSWVFAVGGSIAFCAFRMRRFGSFSGYCFAWFGHESC